MDLRGLNRVSNSWDFKYDSLLRIADRYEPGDMLAVLDLSAAFHLIPIAKSAWSLLDYVCEISIGDVRGYRSDIQMRQLYAAFLPES